MNAFIVTLPDRPGALASVTEALAHKGINITGFSGATCGDSGTICILTNDESGTREALRDSRWKARERELVVASLADRPGSLAEAARRLADAGVNIEAAVPTGMSGGNISVAFATDQPDKARKALGTEVMTGAHQR
ncbi:MAG TPA: ACT domain-containing protein [Candidatus Dormibacteraeota bacterium]|nr:ACT domain-containing protein [Candidatus Dormibacteraeota bacterium]